MPGKTLAQVMFAGLGKQPDTVTGYMLRALCITGSMTQADFMTMYHERCARAKSTSKSSFDNNFGRFVAWRNVHVRETTVHPADTYIEPEHQIISAPAGSEVWQRCGHGLAANPYRCIARSRRLGTGANHGRVRVNRLWFTLEPDIVGSWTGTAPAETTHDELLRSLDDAGLGLAEQWSERALTDGSRDVHLWRHTIDLEIRYRAAKIKTVVPRLFKQITSALGKREFIDWYENGCDDFPTGDGPALRDADAIAFGHLRELAAQQSMTVLELLDYERVTVIWADGKRHIRWEP